MKILKHKYRWVVIITGLVLLNVAARFIHFRIDLTDDQRYTLSPGTRQLLKNIDSTITIEVLLKGEFPAVFRKLQNSTADLLTEMRSYAGSKLVVNFIKPGEGLSDSAQVVLFDSLKVLGIQPYTLQVQQKPGESAERVIYPAALVKYQQRIIPIDLLAGKTEYSRDPLTGRLQLDEAKSINNAEALLEFKFADAIEKIQRKQKPLIAYLIGNGEPTGPETYDLVQTLTSDYDLRILNPNEVNAIPLEFAAVMIVKPSLTFSDSVRMKIDQYIMQGGKVLWFLDMLFAEKDSLAIRAQTLAYDRNLNLDDLLFRYGVRINRDLLQDLQCDMSKLVVGIAGSQPQLADVPFNYYPLLNASPQHPISKNLEPVLTRFTNTLDTVKGEGIRKQVLLTSSENAKTVSTPAIISLQELKTIENTALYKKKNLPAAILLEGSFTSLFTNRASQEMRNYFAQAYGSFAAKSKPTGMLIVGDGDMVLNDYTRQEAFPMGYSRVLDRSFANRSFLQNCLQYMTGNAAIVSLRNKDFSLRLLNKEKLETRRLLWQTINILGPVILVVLGGLLYTYLRKRKYTRPLTP